MDAEQNLLWVERLSHAARTGRIENLGKGADSAAAKVDRKETVPQHQRVPADALRQVLLSDELQFDPRGLTIRGAHIDGELDLNHSDLPCPLRLEQCFIPDALDLSGCHLPMLDLSESYCADLRLQDMQVNGHVRAVSLKSSGPVSLLGARIDGRLSLRKATLVNPEGDALVLDGAQIDGGVFARDLKSKGVIRAVRACLGITLELEEAVLKNPMGDALVLDGAQIEWGVFARGLVTEGAMRAVGARVGSQLDLQKAELCNPKRDALVLDRAEVMGFVAARSLQVEGTVKAVGLRISDQLDLQLAQFNFSEKNSPPATVSLVLDRAQIEGDVVGANLKSRGVVQAVGARIGGELELRNAQLINQRGKALCLSSTSISVLSLKDTVTIEGNFVLEKARIGSIVTNDLSHSQGTFESLGRLVATGWNIGDVEGWLRNDNKAARDWLLSGQDHPNFVPQPWHELARVYDRNGHATEARRLRYWAAVHTSRQQPRKSRIIQFVYRWLVGYGYYPLVTLVWFGILYLLAFVLIVNNTESFVPASPSEAQIAYEAIFEEDEKTEAQDADNDPEVELNGAMACEDLVGRYPCFNSFSYAASIAAPISATSVDAWSTSEQWLESVLMLLRFAGWILTAFLLAGLTGLLRKA